MDEVTELFDEALTFPDSDAKRAFDALVGLDDLKARLVKEGGLLLNKRLLDDWSKKHYGKSIPILSIFRDRSPLFILGGDVGTGKTSLAKSFGDAIARQSKGEVKLFALSLTARGKGAVGQMTTLISSAFAEIRREAHQGKGKNDRAVILLIDEADALAQSRENAQMHHEDRAGVNALIRGVDDLVNRQAPVLIVMCTNRLGAIDPAVMRRAAGVFKFERPNSTQRAAVFSGVLEGIGVETAEIEQLVAATGPTDGRSYGFTYSDLTHRLLPSLVVDAFPDQPIRIERALEILRATLPTPPFFETHTSREHQ